MWKAAEEGQAGLQGSTAIPAPTGAHAFATASVNAPQATGMEEAMGWGGAGRARRVGAEPTGKKQRVMVETGRKGGWVEREQLRSNRK